MEILHNLKANLEIEDEELNEFSWEFKSIDEKLANYGIALDEQSRIGFYSHMVSFVRRVKGNERIMEITGLDSQIEKETVEIARDIVKPIFEKHDTNIDKSEVLLVAIHIQAAKSK